MIYNTPIRSWISAAAFIVIAVVQVAFANKPAVLFAGFNNRCDYSFAQRLVEDGFEVNSRPVNLDESPLDWDEVKGYNVLVLAGLGHANADGTVSKGDLETIAVIRRFVNDGGGVFYVPSWLQMDSLIAPQIELLRPWGIEAGFEEIVFEKADKIKATPWPVDFSYAVASGSSPVMDGVEGIWIPVETRVGMQAHLVPFSAGPNWSLELSSSPSTYSKTVPGDQAKAGDLERGGLFGESVPLVASRELYRGRVVVCGIRGQDWFWGPYAASTLEGAALDRGLNNKPSGGYQMVVNSLRWLAEPSIAIGQFGGATTLPKQLENPHVPKPAPLNDWEKLIRYDFPMSGEAWPGVIGARSAFSGGEGSVEEWVTLAKESGLKYLVFLEDFAELESEEFRQLTAQCSAFTSADFVALPGFRIKDEAGNYYFYASPNLRYPPAEILSDDGTCFVSFDAQLNPADPRGMRGQLNHTVLRYSYQFCGFRLMAGNYFFNRDGAPVSDWFGNYQAVGVITHEDGKIVEDAIPSYLKMVDSGQSPLPMVIDLVKRPADLLSTPWRTVVRSGLKEEGNPVSKFFSEWHFYPENPSRIFVTEGPQIDRWASMGRSDYEGPNQGDSVWQNLRWRVSGTVRSGVGIREVIVYDGDEIFRRFRPGGVGEYSFTLDLSHNCQRNLTLQVTDSYGRRALSSELWNRNHRLQEIMCADRNNQLTYGYTIRKSDGTALLLGGNGALSTPNKRLSDRFVRPSGVFKNDPFLGSAAFDGVTGNDPEISTAITLFRDGLQPLKAPRVGESLRLLHTGDVNIGESVSRYRFRDGIPEHNVWHTLWKAEESGDLVVTQRNHLFQIDPDNPLSVTLVDLEVGSKSSLPGPARLELAGLKVNEARTLVVRTEDSLFEQRDLDGVAGEYRVPLARGGYVAALNSPQGGCAVIPLNDNLEISWSLPASLPLTISSLNSLPFEKAGEVCRFSFLFVGVPRSTRYTEHLRVKSREVIERFTSDFGLDGTAPRYGVEAAMGRVIEQGFPLRIDGSGTAGFSGKLRGDLTASLPVQVSGLRDGWTAMLLDHSSGEARPLGVFEGGAWATLILDAENDLFIGHPVVCDNDEVMIQLTQTSDKDWRLEVHNPTGSQVQTKLGANPGFNLLNQNSLPTAPVFIEAGASVFFDLRSE